MTTKLVSRYNHFMLRVRVTPARGDPFERRIETGPLIVGRSSVADLMISDPFLSRRHARLAEDGEGWKIEDLGSRNGTWVDGRCIEESTPLPPGAVITFSGSRITVLEAGEEKVGTEPGEEGPGETEDGPLVTVLRPAAEVLSEATAMAGPARADTEEDGAPEPGEPVTEDLSLEVESLRRRAERLALLTEVHRALGLSVALDELLQLILDRVFDLLGPEEGVVFLRDGEGHLEPAAYRTASQHASGVIPGEIDLQALDDTVLRSRTLEREVVDKGLAALALDTRQDDRFSTSESLMAHGVRSFLAAPLLAEGGRALGMIVLTSGHRKGLYTEEDLSLLVSLASVAALRILNVELTRDAIDRRRLEAELTLARRIQVALHAGSLPEVGGWEFHAGNRPSQGVSGDMYQVLERQVSGQEGGEPSAEMVLMVADVAGKGIAASILTATLEALAAGPIERGSAPEEVAGWLSRQLLRRTPPEKYATLFLAALDPATGALRWVNAGHPPALLLRGWGTEAGGVPGVERLEASGPPVGLVPADEYEAGETVLAEGDLLLLYTDGLTEAADPEGRELGVEGLEAICRRHAGSPAEELAAALDREIDEFTGGAPPVDDRTVVVLQRAG